MISSRRSNVVDAVTRLIGRSAVQQRLEERLAEPSRLVTLRGPAGVGKSRLALAVVAGLPLNRYPGGIGSCDLTEASGEAEVCAKLLNALECRSPEPHELLPQAVARHLSKAGPLFVWFDNVESALAPLTALLGIWLPACGNLHCLVTCRERLGVMAEVVIPLEPLADEAAIELFRERMDAARGAPVSVDPVVAHQLIRKLDGLPLALELCAAHACTLQPEELLERLDPSLPFLTSSDRSAPERTRSLRGALESAWTMLSAVERRALMTLAQFRGEFDLVDAESAFRDPAVPTAALLRRLCECSLLRAESVQGKSRFRLYRATREYAIEQLVREPTSSVVGSRFTEYVLERARECQWSEGDPSLLSWICRHAETLLAVARNCLECSQLDSAVCALLPAARAATLQGPVLPVLSLFEELPLDAVSSAELRTRALYARGRLRARHGDVAGAQADLEVAYAEVQRAEFLRNLRPFVATDLGNFYRHQGDFARAALLFERALSTGQEETAGAGSAAVLAAIAGMAHEQGELARAHHLFERALTVAREHALPLTEASTLQNLGLVFQELGRPDEAAKCYETAIHTHRQLGHTRFEGIAEYDFACLALERDAVGQAKRGFQRALKLACDVGDRRESGLCLALLAVCQAMGGEIEQAQEGMDAAERVLRVMAQPAPLLAIQLHRGHLELAASLQAFEAGDEAGREQKLASATARLDPGESVEVSSDDVRYARRVLEAACRRYAAVRQHAIVANDGRWFQMAGGKRVDLTKRLPLRRLLCALIAQRLHAPNEVVAVDELIRAGWPGEKSVDKSATNRLHVAITTLRKSGLETHLVRIAGGYRLERTLLWNAEGGASTNVA